MDRTRVNLSGVLSTYDSSVRELQNVAADLEDENRNLQSHNDELNTEYQKESEAVKALNALYEVTRARMESTKELKAQLLMELEATEAKVTQLEIKTKEWKSKMEEVQNTKNKLKDHISRIKNNYKGKFMEIPLIAEAEKVSRELQDSKARLLIQKQEYKALQEKLRSAHQARKDDWNAFQNTCIEMAQSYSMIRQMQKKVNDIRLKKKQNALHNMQARKNISQQTEEVQSHKEASLNRALGFTAPSKKPSTQARQFGNFDSTGKKFGSFQNLKTTPSPLSMLQQYKSFNNEGVKPCSSPMEKEKPKSSVIRSDSRSGKTLVGQGGPAQSSTPSRLQNSLFNLKIASPSPNLRNKTKEIPAEGPKQPRGLFTNTGACPSNQIKKQQAPANQVASFTALKPDQTKNQDTKNNEEVVFKIPEEPQAKKSMEPSQPSESTGSTFFGQDFFTNDNETGSSSLSPFELSFTSTPSNEQDDFFSGMGFAFDSQPAKKDEEKSDPLKSIFGYSPLKSSHADTEDKSYTSLFNI